MTKSKTFSTHSPLALFDLHVEALSGAITCIWFLRNHRLFSKSTRLISASHATNHGCSVNLALSSTASKMASFLGVHPSVFQKCDAKTLITSTHLYPSLGDFTLQQLLPSCCQTLSARVSGSQVAGTPQSKRLSLRRPRCLIHSGHEFLLAAHVPRDSCTSPRRHGGITHQHPVVLSSTVARVTEG